MNTDSGKSLESVHVKTRMPVHLGSEQVFTLSQNGCSRWARICTLGHDLLQEGVTQVQGDFKRCKQVLTNLVSNAIKYNKAQGQVHITCQSNEEEVCLLVKDTGIGLAPEQQAQLFEPFNRLGAESSGVEGTGIGLTITRQLIELMEGRIGVISTPGEGSQFWFTLPKADC